MNRILITGANGQLGSELKVLSEEMTGFEYCFTDYDTLDITDQVAMRTFMQDRRPDFVVNCAAYTAVDKAEEEPESCFRLNGKAPGIVAAACQEYGAKLIHISTDYVFDGTSCIPYNEDQPVKPLGVYGASKREGEVQVFAHSDAIVIRTSWLYSSFGSNFVKTMIRLGRERNQVNVVFDQTGTPTYAADLAAVILKIISRSTADPDCWKPGIYHYSNEGVCSWYDFALAVHRLAGIQCHVSPVESADFQTKAIRPCFSVLNKAKIKKTFYISIPHWEESLEKCIRLLT